MNDAAAPSTINATGRSLAVIDASFFQIPSATTLSSNLAGEFADGRHQREASRLTSSESRRRGRNGAELRSKQVAFPQATNGMLRSPEERGCSPVGCVCPWPNLIAPRSSVRIQRRGRPVPFADDFQRWLVVILSLGFFLGRQVKTRVGTTDPIGARLQARRRSCGNSMFDVEGIRVPSASFPAATRFC